MCCTEREEGRGGLEERREGGREGAQYRERKGRVGEERRMRRGGGEGLNASHVKLMRTNLQKLESCFPFTNSLLLLFCFLSPIFTLLISNFPNAETL